MSSLLQNYRYARMTDLMGRIPSRPAVEVERIQQTRLRKLLSHARQHSRFYRRKFAVIPDSGQPDLSLFPVTTKEEIRHHFDDVVTDSRLRRSDLESFISDDSNLGKWYLGDYAVCHTSGSQGSPLLIVQDRHSLRVVLATMSSRCRPGKRPGIVEGIQKLIRPPRVAVISFRRGFYPSGMTLEFMADHLGPLARISRFSSIQPDLAEQLNEFQPQVISGYASVLEALALRPDKLNLHSVQYLTNSSEQLSRRARNRIEETFQAPIVDHYGTGECLQLADGCQHCGDLHLNADWAILENVDDQYRPVPAGEPGSRVLLTNLANHVQPFIRYEVPDRVRLRQDDGSCLNHLPRIEGIEGRNADLFWVLDNGQERFLTGVLFHSATDSLQIVREWRAIQKEQNRIEIHLQLLPGHVASADELKRRLRLQLLQDGLPPAVTIQVVICDELLADHRTGKMRRMISELNNGTSGNPDSLHRDTVPQQISASL